MKDESLIIDCLEQEIIDCLEQEMCLKIHLDC